MRLNLSGFCYMYLLPHRPVHMFQHYHNLNTPYSIFAMVFYMRICPQVSYGHVSIWFDPLRRGLASMKTPEVFVSRSLSWTVYCSMVAFPASPRFSPSTTASNSEFLVARTISQKVKSLSSPFFSMQVNPTAPHAAVTASAVE